MNTSKIHFENSDGLGLTARLELPAQGSPSAYAIFAHCFTCSKDLNAVITISRTLSLSNIAVLRFDFTGLGESDGEFENTNFSSNVGDLVSAADFLRTEYEAPSLLIGHSLGGAAVLAAAGRIPEVKAVATIGAPADPHHVEHLFEDQLEEIREKGSAQVSIGGRPFSLSKQFLNDIHEAGMEELVGNLNRALLIMHSPQDQIVEVDNARITYLRAMHPKSFVSLDGADHLLSDSKDSEYVATIISAWVGRYVDLEPKDVLPESDRQVVVRTGDEGYTTEVRAGRHSFLADEPTSLGGKDLGPTPYDFLVTALGTCTSITLRMYADRKKWPLEQALVHVQHGKVHEIDSESNENPKAKIDKISREIELVGPLDEEQRARLMEIADRCPVHKTLSGDIRIDTLPYRGSE
jgi:putative redox protein